MKHSHPAHPALAIDLGDARIGIAASDDMGIMAHPVETIHRQHTEPLGRIAQLVEERKIRTLILGLPLHSDGSEGDAAAKARKFGKRLSARLPGLPLHYIDESFSTLSAATKLREAGRKAKKQKDIIDQAAAVEILNSWMTRLQ